MRFLPVGRWEVMALPRLRSASRIPHDPGAVVAGSPNYTCEVLDGCESPGRHPTKLDSRLAASDGASSAQILPDGVAFRKPGTYCEIPLAPANRRDARP